MGARVSMLIYSMKPDHDGGVAIVDSDSQELVLAYEAEKDSFPRYSVFNPVNMLEAAGRLDRMPDVFAVSGWGKPTLAPNNSIGAGYDGVSGDHRESRWASVFGQRIRVFSSTHALSHIWSSYGMSPYEQGEPCYALVWEGALGDFYEIDSQLDVHHLGQVMKAPGNKYSFLYSLADPASALPRGHVRYSDPGKLMALCGYGESGTPTAEEWDLIDALLEHPSFLDLAKDDLRDSRYHDIGLRSPAFTRLARRFSDELFHRFERFARANLTKGYPLLVSGGCGLNCDWNSAWRSSGLFEDVFVPPCVNDTGSAIGTAVDAMRHFTGKAKISWDVYRGQEFVDDTPDMPDVVVHDLDLAEVADFLARDHVVAWANGRCEIGPRALGNRSLLAAPFSRDMTTRLNKIKNREDFRPIAPICLEEDVERHFVWRGPSPHMLYFQAVRDPGLEAVTHVDGTTRVQTVRADQNPLIHGLLTRFRDRTGTGVLCNTSLNYHGSGFINRTSDLYEYCKRYGVDAFVYQGRFCRFR
uniref:carbamoyltransferase C-terminal domain-containing protein n=1 Tax=Herbidospora sakaeratensis TaxID=564415 RepID=UPI001C3F333B|nr:carbamoyltransferase C-terminal domain-containing protein [Herbidospora sakaeratensis]